MFVSVCVCVHFVVENWSSKITAGMSDRSLIFFSGLCQKLLVNANPVYLYKLLCYIMFDT